MLRCGKTVYCDSASADRFWNRRLFKAAGVRCAFEIRYLYDKIDPVNDTVFENACRQTRQDDLVAHRAGDDALLLMRIYKNYYSLKTRPKPSAGPSLAP